VKRFPLSVNDGLVHRYSALISPFGYPHAPSAAGDPFSRRSVKAFSEDRRYFPHHDPSREALIQTFHLSFLQAKRITTPPRQASDTRLQPSLDVSAYELFRSEGLLLGRPFLDGGSSLSFFFSLPGVLKTLDARPISITSFKARAAHPSAQRLFLLHAQDLPSPPMISPSYFGGLSRPSDFERTFVIDAHWRRDYSPLVVCISLRRMIVRWIGVLSSSQNAHIPLSQPLV